MMVLILCDKELLGTGLVESIPPLPASLVGLCVSPYVARFLRVVSFSSLSFPHSLLCFPLFSSISTPLPFFPLLSPCLSRPFSPSLLLPSSRRLVSVAVVAATRALTFWLLIIRWCVFVTFLHEECN